MKNIFLNNRIALKFLLYLNEHPIDQWTLLPRHSETSVGIGWFTEWRDSSRDETKSKNGVILKFFPTKCGETRTKVECITKSLTYREAHGMVFE